jgi:hypothetical protein
MCAETFFGASKHNELDLSTECGDGVVNDFEPGPLLSVFALKVLTGLATVTSEVICKQHPSEKVPLEHLIPDLLQFGIPNIHRISEGISIIQPLGVGKKLKISWIETSD